MNVANWSDGNETKLEPHEPEPIDVVVTLGSTDDPDPPIHARLTSETTGAPARPPSTIARVHRRMK